MNKSPNNVAFDKNFADDVNAAPTFCTVVTASHFGQARALAASMRACYADATLWVLLADEIDGKILSRWQQEYSAEGIAIIALHQLPAPVTTIQRMSFYYTPFELCCALRGLLHQFLWDETKAPHWIFLDADMLLLRPLENVFEQLQSAAVILTPHRFKAPIIKNAATLENSLLCSGLYNAGFVAIRRCDQARQFIDWFASRLEFYALDDPRGRGWFVDQLWLNLAPQYFSNVQACEDSGVNVGHWNLFDARFECDQQNDEFFVDETPLSLFHFSGWNSNQPEIISSHARAEEQLQSESLTAWQLLSSKYKVLLNSFHGDYTPRNCAFKFFEDGREISLWMRRHFWQLCLQDQVPFTTSPFAQSEYFFQAENAARPSLRNRITYKFKKRSSP